MLKKLMKHEWKSISKVGVMLLILMAILTFVAWLSFKTPMWQAMLGMSDARHSTVEFVPHITDIIGIFALMFYFLLISFTSFGFLIYMAVHFYRTMYTDQGYLTHTLPVTSTQLLFSKTIVNAVWALLVNLGMLLSITLVLGSFMNIVFESAGIEWAQVTEEFSVLMSELREIDVNVSLLCGLVICLFVLTPLTSTITIFGAITLGQLAKSARGFMGVVWYVVAYIGQVLIASGVSSVLTVGTMEEYLTGSELATFRVYNASYATSLIIQIIVAVIMWFLAKWVIQKKINLH